MNSFWTNMLNPQLWQSVFCLHCATYFQMPVHTGRTLLEVLPDEDNLNTKFDCPVCNAQIWLRTRVLASSRFQHNNLRPTLELNFSHHYPKLDEMEFTTIRGKHHYRDHKLVPGMEVKICIQEQPYCDAVITQIQFKRIKDFSLEQLQKDGNFPGHPISSHGDFIRLLQTFWRFYHVTMETEVCCYHLARPLRRLL